MELNRKVEHIEDVRDQFDAVFLAVGAHIGKRAYVPAAESAKIMDAVSVLGWIE